MIKLFPKLSIYHRSLFQLIYYNIQKGKIKTSLHIMNSSAIYEKCKSRKLQTSFNCLGLCTSYNETKLHRNNLGKLAISRSNDRVVPLVTHFLKNKFTIATIDNFVILFFILQHFLTLLTKRKILIKQMRDCF